MTRQDIVQQREGGLGTPGDRGPLVSQRPPLVDQRGEIRDLLDGTFGSALVITSVKGAVRGNHYHKTDYHYTWLQRGGLIYAQHPVGDPAATQQWVIRPGQLFYTPPMCEHAMYFTEDSVLIVLARNHRQMADYEADTVRVPALPIVEPS